MAQFYLSAFADEIDEQLSKQMEVLSQHQIKHIEMRGVNGKNVTELTLAEAKDVRKQLDDNGFSLSAVGSPIGKIEITDAFAPHLEVYRHTLDLAGILGTDQIRMFSFYMPKEAGDLAPYRNEVMDRMGQFAELAKSHNITLLHENEKGIYGDTAVRCLDLFTTLNHPNLKGTFDPANYVQAQVDTLQAFDLLQPYTTYMHIKDAMLATGEVVPAGMGDGNIKAILEKLVQQDYNGFLSLEPHLGSFTGAAALEQDDFFDDMPEGGPKLFAMASSALKTILNEMGATFQ